MISLDGAVAIVTGSGRGLGRSHALELARRGARVVVNDVEHDAVDEVIASIEALGGTAVASYDTVATAEGGNAIVATAVRAFGTVDAVVNNAGNSLAGRFEDLTPGDIDRLLDVHVRGAFFVTQPAWRVMIAKQYGRVVLTSSAAAIYGYSGQTNYAAAKAAVYGLGRSLALEGAEAGIAVNVILPRAAGSSLLMGRPIPFPVAPGEAMARDSIEERRTPSAVTAMVAYLASPECTLNGEVFSAGYGWYGRVFAAVSSGWDSGNHASVTAEDVAAHIDEIRDASRYDEPSDNGDEVRLIAQRLGALS